MKHVENLEEVPKSNNHAYHHTDGTYIEDIINSGLISNNKNKEWEKINEFLHMVAEKENISNIPKDRSKCNFLFPRFNDIRDSECVIVVNLKKEKPRDIYRGSYHTVTEIHDIICKEKSMSSAEDIIETKDMDKNSQEAYELSVQYWSNMSKENLPIDKGGELLIPGDIKPESITHVYRK